MTKPEPRALMGILSMTPKNLCRCEACGEPAVIALARPAHIPFTRKTLYDLILVCAKHAEEYAELGREQHAAPEGAH